MKIVLLFAFCLLASAQVMRPVIETIRSRQDSMGVFYTFINMPAMRPYFDLLNAVGVQKTIFLPINSALNDAGLPGDWTTLSLFQAHTLPGRVPFSAWNQNGPTVFSTVLTNRTYVQLPAGYGSLVKGTRVGNIYTLNWGNPQSNATIDPGLYVECTDGIIYVIDTVMGIPPSLQDQLTNYDLSNFRDAVIRGNAQSVMTQSGVTIFAPDNQAFRNTLPGNWLGALPGTWNNLVRFHSTGSLQFFANLTAGKSLQSGIGGAAGRLQVTTGGAGVVNLHDYMGRFLSNISDYEADIVSANGLIHVIDRVMIPNLAFKEELFKKE
jgi:uncharacterized surface protein with fasciclin (FAS1) repeats